MATIAEFKRRFDQMYGSNGINTVISDEVSRTSDVILDLNRDQLLYGRDADGKALTPGYLSDPYFDTFEQAKAYFYMKHKMWREHDALMSYTKIQLFPKRP